MSTRIAGSSQANPYACISAGICSLCGPAHGGANEVCHLINHFYMIVLCQAVLKMLVQIGSVSNIPAYIERGKDKKDPTRLMGFGHRVYKNFDPRAIVMRKMCHEVCDCH